MENDRWNVMKFAEAILYIDETASSVFAGDMLSEKGKKKLCQILTREPEHQCKYCKEYDFQVPDLNLSLEDKDEEDKADSASTSKGTT